MAPSVTIIGAGLGGLSLALALKQRGIEPRFYELRDATYNAGGALMLSPNALKILDNLGIYERIRNKGFNFEKMTFRHDKTFESIGTYYFGNEELYGYKALRIYRKTLLDELRAMVVEQGISIEFHKKFTHVISEDETGVRFAFSDGSEEKADILIGSDGIHSSVRKYLYPDVVPKFAGFIGVTYAFPSAKLDLPVNIEVPVSLHGAKGAFVLAPQSADGRQMFAGRQFAYPAQERNGWDLLLKNKDELTEMHKDGKEDWSDLVQSAIAQVDSEEAQSTLSIWPFHAVPHMDKWSSASGKVIITGDAAHAIPPTSGQGVNQAFEDALALAVALSSPSDKDLSTRLELLREYRQSRIAGIIKITNQMNNMRLPAADKAALPEDEVWSDGGNTQLGWLYEADVEADVNLLYQ